MADYPASIPTIAADKIDATTSETDHPAHHNQLAQELVAGLTTLGVNPQGSEASVAARIAAHEADDTIHSSGRELGYAEITSDYGGSSLAAAEADVTGLSITVTVGVRPIRLEFFGLTQKQANAGALLVYLYEGAQKLATGGGTLAVNDFLDASVKRRLAPSAGSHTYKVRMAMSSVGGKIVGTADGPAYVQAVEV